MSKYFYYGFSGKVFLGEDIEKTVEFLSSGEITPENFYRIFRDGTGFCEYAYGCTCFILSEKVSAIKIKQINRHYFPFLQKAQRMFFSEYDDEWRLRKKIPVSAIVGIGLPFEQVKIFDWNGNPYFQRQLQELLTLASDLKLDIVDSSSLKFPTEYEELKAYSNRRIYDASLESLVRGDYVSKYFYHGLERRRSSLDKLFSILTTGGIKCKRLLNYGAYYGYNDRDYVSVCKKYPVAEYRDFRTNAFYEFVFNSFCLIISDDVNAIKMSLDDIQKNSLDQQMDLRVSDMFDEWQVYEKIPLSSIIGIGLPLKNIKKFMRNLQKEDFELLRKIIMIATKLGLDIVDSSDSKFVEKYERKKMGNPGKVYQAKIDIYTHLDIR